MSERRRNSANVRPRFGSTVMLSDVDLPSPKLPIPMGYVPRYLKSAHGQRPPDPGQNESRPSFTRIGGLHVPGFQHPTPTTPKFHVRRGTPSRSRTHARLMTQSWSPNYIFPNRSIPFSLKYFGESDNIIGCFTETVPVTVPDDYRGSTAAIKTKVMSDRDELRVLRYAQPAMPPKSSPR
jgi:hypothetical protein